MLAALCCDAPPPPARSGAQRGGGGGGLEVRQLTAAVDEMHRRGGKDPLPAVLKGASRAQLQAGKGSGAAAATAAAAANGGRTKQWGDSPAVRVRALWGLYAALQ